MPTLSWAKYVSLQSMLADLMVDLYEDELEDEDLRAASDAIGFRCIDRFLAGVAVDRADSASCNVEYSQWREQFCSGFGMAPP